MKERMNKLGILLSGIVTCILSIIFLPEFVIYLIGCYQIGSWVGQFVEKLIVKEDEKD
jgi:hypothetical protein